MPPVDVAISRTTAFELDVTWSPPAEGLYDSFSLTYSRVGTSEVTTIPVPASDAPSVTLPDLLPETSYAVSVVSVRGTINSQPAETSGTTGNFLSSFFQGPISQNLSSVTNDSFCNKLLKSLLLIGYQQICP